MKSKKKAKKKPDEKKIYLPKIAAVAFQELPAGVYAQCFPKERLVVLDLCKEHDVGETYFHELLHITFPKLGEQMIEALSHKMWKNMGQKERYKIYISLFCNVQRVYM